MRTKQGPVGRVVLGAAAALLALAACDGGDVAPAAPDAPATLAGRILVEVYEGGDGSWLYVMDAASGQVEELGVITDPGSHWSPDGTRILVASLAGPPETEKPVRPATVASDGSDFQLLDGVEDRRLNVGCSVFSPDGTRLLCTGYSDFVAGIYTVRASDGGGLRALTLTDTVGMPSDYSPDGEQIVFLGEVAGASTSDEAMTLFVVGSDGTDLREITEPNSVLAYRHAAWSPDGEWIVFAGADRTLRLVHPDGTELHAIPLDPDAGVGDVGGGAIWSPDGAWIAFSAVPVGGEEPDIFVVRPDGSELRRITDTPSVAEFAADWTA